MQKEILFHCMECGKKFRTLDAAEKASWNGCPKCGGGDIEPYYQQDTRLTNSTCLKEIKRILKLELSNTEKVFRVQLALSHFETNTPYVYGKSLTL